MNALINDRGQKISETQSKKSEARKKIKAISEGKWNIVQRLLQEIEADCILRQAKDNKMIEFKEKYDLLKLKIETEYADDPELKEVVLDYLPTPRGVLNWTKLNGWNDEITAVLRKEHLFRNETRAEVIMSLYKKAVSGDTQAAKVWLTMSGDYTDKVDVADSKFEKYKEYTQALQSGRPDND